MQHACLAIYQSEMDAKEMSGKDPFEVMLSEQQLDGNWKINWHIIEFVRKCQPKFRMSQQSVLELACKDYPGSYVATVLVMATLQLYCNDRIDEWRNSAEKAENYMANLLIEGDARNLIIQVFRAFGL